MKSDIIAFDYYDGPTEGLALTLHGDGPWYFRLVAWDEDQDQRLFAAIRVQPGVYERLIELLPEQQRSASPVWVLPWRFAQEQDRVEADAIVESCASWLRQQGSRSWVLGEQFQDGAKIFRIERTDEDDLQRVLSSGEPEDLRVWLAHRLKGRV